MVSCSRTRAPNPGADPQLKVTAARAAEFLHINSMALLPPEFDRAIRSVVDQRDEVLALLRETALTRTEITLVDNRTLTAAMPPALTNFSAASAVAIGQKTAADAVLLTRVLKYDERVGSSVGVNKPAQVHFAMWLYRVTDGKIIWQASYLFSDRSLSDNLLALRDRSPDAPARGWRTARELLRHGLEAAFRDIAERRRGAFIGAS